MHEILLGEFMGTLILVLLGNGVVAGVSLERSKSAGAGWIVITAGWAFAVMAGVFTAAACGSNAAQLNPAITLGFALTSGDWTKAAPMILAQLLGAFAGAFLVWVHYFPHWAQTKDEESKRACFCTGPAIRNMPANMASEIIATFVLVFVVAAISSKRATAIGVPTAGLGPYLVASLVWGIGMSLGGTTGYAINPARDLGPRLAHAVLPIAGKGNSDWSYALVPILGPSLGGLFAGALIRFLHL